MPIQKRKSVKLSQTNHAASKELALRQAVLMGDTGAIVSAIDAGADPNFIAKSLLPGVVLALIIIFDFLNNRLTPSKTRPETVETL